MARRRRGISLGTVLMLTVTALSLTVGAWILLRVGGVGMRASLSPLFRSGAATVTPAPLPTAEAAIAMTTLIPAQTQPPAAPSAQLPTAPPSRRVTITAVGQITVGSELREAGLDKATGQADYSLFFRDVADRMAGDLSIATLRSTLAGEAAGYATYNAPDAVAVALRGAGVTALNLGTDRILDFGISGLGATVEAASRAGLVPMGARRSQAESLQPVIVEANGVKIGLLSLVSGVSSAGRKAASGEEIAFAVSAPEVSQVQAMVAGLRGAGAEIVVATLHAGNRSDTKPSAAVREMVTALANGGADVILCTNPTAVQTFERRVVSDAYGAQREVFIAYSLGNFLIDDSRDTAAITGVILNLTLEYDQAARRATIASAAYAPTWIMRWKTDGVTRYRVVPANSATVPDGMTETIYLNMKKSYQSVVARLGMEQATPY